MEQVSKRQLKESLDELHAKVNRVVRILELVHREKVNAAGDAETAELEQLFRENQSDRVRREAARTRSGSS